MTESQGRDRLPFIWLQFFGHFPGRRDEGRSRWVWRFGPTRAAALRAPNADI